MSDADLEIKTRQKTQRPPLYRVVFLNDDFTPFDFVIMVLMRIFGQTVEEAEAVAAEVHLNGTGAVGFYTREVAETKVMQAMGAARRREYPLTCSVEPA